MVEQGYINVSIVKEHISTSNVDTNYIRKMCCRPLVGDLIDLPTKDSSTYSNLRITAVKHCVNGHGEPYLEIKVHNR